jgi:hypothetical protein
MSIGHEGRYKVERVSEDPSGRYHGLLRAMCVIDD